MKTWEVQVCAGKIEVKRTMGQNYMKDKTFKLIVSATTKEEAAEKALAHLRATDNISEETLYKIKNNTTLQEDGRRIMNENYFSHHDVHVYEEPLQEVSVVWESDEF